MKDKQVACIILAFVIAGLAYGMQTFHRKLVGLQQEVASTESEVDTARSTRDQASINLKKLKEETKGLRDYFDLWQPYLGSAAGVQRQEQKVFDTIKNAAVFASSQRTEIVQNNGSKEAFIPKKLRAHLVIQDDYAKTMNWFGTLEQELPTSRISNFKMTKGVSRNDVQLEITVDFPLIATSGS